MRWRLVFLTLTACNAILSNEDRTLRTADASAPDAPIDPQPDGGPQSEGGGPDAPPPDAEAGTPGVEILVTGLTGPQQVAVVGGKLYWSHQNGLGWCQLPDCTVKKPFHTGNDPGPYGLAVDATGVLVGSTNNDFVYTYPLAYDGTGQALIAGSVDPAGVALDGNDAFFATRNGLLFRCGRSNNCAGGPTLVSRGAAPGAAVSVGSTKVVWGSARVDGGGAGSGFLQEADKNAVDGGNIAVSYGRDPRTLLMDGVKLHWTATAGPVSYDGEVSKRDNGLGSATEEFYALKQKEPWGIAIDTTHVYFSVATAPGVLRRCSLGGPFPAEPEDVVTGQATPHGIALDATHVYWANFGNGSIARFRKP